MTNSFLTNCTTKIQRIITDNTVGDFPEICQIYLHRWTLEERIMLLRLSISNRSKLAVSVFTECAQNPGLCNTLWEWIYSLSNQHYEYITQSDQILTRYCSNTPTDPLCGCMNAPLYLQNIKTASSLPYYCWYRPCKDVGVYRTSSMRHQQSLCIGTACSISIGAIIVGTTNTTILNTCTQPLTDISALVSTSIEALSDRWKPPIEVVSPTQMHSTMGYIEYLTTLLPVSYISLITMMGIFTLDTVSPL